MVLKLPIKSDSVGAIASGLCLLHCIATPLVFVVQPITSQIETAPVWWKSLDYVFLALSFFAVYWSALNTARNWVKYALWISWVALTIAIFNEKFEVFHWPELIIYIPAIALIFLHLFNRKYCQCADEKCCVDEQGIDRTDKQ